MQYIARAMLSMRMAVTAKIKNRILEEGLSLPMTKVKYFGIPPWRRQVWNADVIDKVITRSLSEEWPEEAALHEIDRFMITCGRCDGVGFSYNAARRRFRHRGIWLQVFCKSCKATIAVTKWHCECGVPWHHCDKHVHIGFACGPRKTTCNIEIIPSTLQLESADTDASGSTSRIRQRHDEPADLTRVVRHCVHKPSEGTSYQSSPGAGSSTDIILSQYVPIVSVRDQVNKLNQRDHEHSAAIARYQNRGDIPQGKVVISPSVPVQSHSSQVDSEDQLKHRQAKIAKTVHQNSVVASHSTVLNLASSSGASREVQVANKRQLSATHHGRPPKKSRRLVVRRSSPEQRERIDRVRESAKNPINPPSPDT